jgi:hypothetical protein
MYSIDECKEISDSPAPSSVKSFATQGLDTVRKETSAPADKASASQVMTNFQEHIVDIKITKKQESPLTHPDAPVIATDAAAYSGGRASLLCWPQD